MRINNMPQLSYVEPLSATMVEGTMMNLAVTDDAFQCDDGKGNGCGRIFDELIVKRVRGLCAGCAEDLPEDEDC